MILKDICDQVVADPALAARDGKTYCNIAARRIALVMDATIPEGMLANDIIGFLLFAQGWKEAASDIAHAHASNGGLAFVAMSNAPHGHVAAVYPAPMAESGSWGQKVPIIANVGKANGIMRLSGAFRAADKAKLRYFVYG